MSNWYNGHMVNNNNMKPALKQYNIKMLILDGVPASEMTREQLEGHVRRLQV